MVLSVKQKLHNFFFFSFIVSTARCCFPSRYYFCIQSNLVFQFCHRHPNGMQSIDLPVCYIWFTNDNLYLCLFSTLSVPIHCKVNLLNWFEVNTYWEHFILYVYVEFALYPKTLFNFSLNLIVIALSFQNCLLSIKPQFMLLSRYPFLVPLSICWLCDLVWKEHQFKWKIIVDF